MLYIFIKLEAERGEHENYPRVLARSERSCYVMKGFQCMGHVSLWITAGRRDQAMEKPSYPITILEFSQRERTCLALFV